MILLWYVGSKHPGWSRGWEHPRAPPLGGVGMRCGRWDLLQQMTVIIQGTWGINVASVLTESTGWLEPENFQGEISSLLLSFHSCWHHKNVGVHHLIYNSLSLYWALHRSSFSHLGQPQSILVHCQIDLKFLVILWETIEYKKRANTLEL